MSLNFLRRRILLSFATRSQMKVGDLVKFDSDLENDVFETNPRIEHGLVVQISKTGHDTTSAQVLFKDGELWWVDSGKLEVVSEGGR